MLAPFALILLVLMLSLMTSSCRVRKAMSERIETTEARGFERIERLEGGAVRLTSDSLRIIWERFRADGSLEVRGRLERGTRERETIQTRQIVHTRDTVWVQRQENLHTESKTEGGVPLPWWVWLILGTISALSLALYLIRLTR